MNQPITRRDNGTGINYRISHSKRNSVNCSRVAWFTLMYKNFSNKKMCNNPLAANVSNWLKATNILQC